MRSINTFQQQKKFGSRIKQPETLATRHKIMESLLLIFSQITGDNEFFRIFLEVLSILLDNDFKNNSNRIQSIIALRNS